MAIPRTRVFLPLLPTMRLTKLGYAHYLPVPIIRQFSYNDHKEGDNTVMALQTAQYLIKSLTQMMQVSARRVGDTTAALTSYGGCRARPQ